MVAGGVTRFSKGCFHNAEDNFQNFLKAGDKFSIGTIMQMTNFPEYCSIQPREKQGFPKTVFITD